MIHIQQDVGVVPPGNELKITNWSGSESSYCLYNGPDTYLTDGALNPTGDASFVNWLKAYGESGFSNFYALNLGSCIYLEPSYQGHSVTYSYGMRPFMGNERMYAKTKTTMAGDSYYISRGLPANFVPYIPARSRIRVSGNL